MRKLDARTKQEQGTTQPGRKGGTGMATVRSIVSIILVALIVMAGHASARSMIDLAYINQNLAVSLGTWIDTDGDGHRNVLAYDVNRDGRWDAYRYSTFPNGYLNGVMFDVSVDQTFSSVRHFIDTTGSGRFNTSFEFNASGGYYALDPEEDGHYTAWARIPAPLVQSVPQPTVVQSVPRPTTTNGALLLQRSYEIQNNAIARWLAPACNSSRNGCW